jgi:hypothetical protein
VGKFNEKVFSKKLKLKLLTLRWKFEVRDLYKQKSVFIFHPACGPTRLESSVQGRSVFPRGQMLSAWTPRPDPMNQMKISVRLHHHHHHHCWSRVNFDWSSKSTTQKPLLLHRKGPIFKYKYKRTLENGFLQTLLRLFKQMKSLLFVIRANHEL